MLIFGAPKSGKTRIAHAMASADLCAQQSGRRCVSCWPTSVRGCWMRCRRVTCWTRERSTATSRPWKMPIKALASNLKKRLPPPDLTTAQLRSRSWWTGPDIVLLVDDWHMIVAASGMSAPMAPLAPLLPAAVDIGLHIIVTCQMSQAHRATMDKFVGAAYGAGSPTMFLSGEKTEFPSSEIKLQAPAPWPGIFGFSGWRRKSFRRPTWIRPRSRKRIGVSDHRGTSVVSTQPASKAQYRRPGLGTGILVGSSSGDSCRHTNNFIPCIDR